MQSAGIPFFFPSPNVHTVIIIYVYIYVDNFIPQLQVEPMY